MLVRDETTSSCVSERRADQGHGIGGHPEKLTFENKAKVIKKGAWCLRGGWFLAQRPANAQSSARPRTLYLKSLCAVGLGRDTGSQR